MIVHSCLLLITLLLTSIHHVSATEFAITQKEGSASRLGDQILLYSNAKWLAYKYNIPFYATPFKNSIYFSMHTVDKLLDTLPKKFLSRVVEIHSEDELIQHLKNTSLDTLFVVIYQTEIHFSSKLVLNGRWPDKYMNIYAHSREHPEFYKSLRLALTPQKPNPIALPKDRISVAVHIRKGSGDDAATSSVQYIDEWEYIISHKIHMPNLAWGIDRGNPFRFPPEQFYVDQILNLSSLINHQPMLVHIFTDDKNPAQLTKRLKMRMPLPNIIFSYNEQDTLNRANNDFSILEDLYNMSQFECFIKPESGFSSAAQLIGMHKITIYPQICNWHTESSLNQSILHITGSGIIFYNTNMHAASFHNFDEITKQHRHEIQQLF